MFLAIWILNFDAILIFQKKSTVAESLFIEIVKLHWKNIVTIFKVHNQEITDTVDIANRFCSYFSSIGPNLAIVSRGEWLWKEANFKDFKQ